ncbi:MAG: aminotransferase [Pseudomonadota bacterium]
MTAAALNPRLTAALASPIMEAAGWAAAAAHPANRPLIDLSQAVPSGPPSLPIREALAAAAMEDPSAHLYCDVLGRRTLRDAIAAEWSGHYQGEITGDQIAVTAGCNQAFCAAISSLAGPGDDVILPSPWYFNHKMWLDMTGVACRPLPVGGDGLPDPERVAALVGERTRAIALVSPNNPMGVEYPADLLDALFDVAAAKGVALVIDETYRDYHSAEGSPHRLFQRSDWPQNLIHLYSFSKIMRLTGHRTGALIADEDRVAQIEKFLDTVTICPSQMGQIGALTGLEALAETRSAEKSVYANRLAALRAEFAAGVGEWRLIASGAYFAYVEHPFAAQSDEVCRRLVADQSVLILPGIFFGPDRSEGGDGFAERTCRIAFANVDEAGIAEMAQRLRAFAL